MADCLSRLDAALPLPTRERERIVTEAADALACAIEAAVAKGDPAPAAALSAVAAPALTTHVNPTATT